MKQGTFSSTRADGLSRMQAFVPHAGTEYARGRNHDPGPGKQAAVSRLSPWLRHRLLLESEVVAATLDAHSLERAEKFVQEVFWRTYFKGWLEHHPETWARYRRDLDAAHGALEENSGRARAHREAVEGRTGIDCFDAWAEELVSSNYLHNHTRMWFASIWIFTLRLPWQLGADFFMRHLLDGDPASNTLSWRWVGGLHTVGKTYLARPDNIKKYTDGRFAPAGQLASAAEPLAEPERPPRITPALPANAGPGPSTGLLLTDDDLHVESWLEHLDPAALLIADTHHGRSPAGCASAVTRFVSGAIADTKRRAETRTAAPVEVVANDTMETLAAAVADWAEARRLARVVTPYPTAGPARTFSAALRPALAGRSVALEYTLRDYDRFAWPAADRGFFKLKKKIPAIVRTLGIEGMAAAS